MRTRFHVFLNCTALRRIQMLVQLAADVLGNFFTSELVRPLMLAVWAGESFCFHDVIYSLSCSRRKTRARRSLDFTAGTESFKIFPVSSADCPSTSRNIKTTR
jgi:hypothetical protein